MEENTAVGNDDSTKEYINTYRQFYVDKDNELKEVRFKPITHDSQLLNEIRLLGIIRGSGMRAETVEVNCAEINIDSICKKPSEEYQRLSKNKIQFQLRWAIKGNSESIIKYLLACGWPDDPELNEYFCFSLLHARPNETLYFYEQIKQRAELDMVSDSMVATIYDRILTANGQPQLYGTQSHGRPEYGLHDIRDSVNVDARRKLMGLSPLEDQKSFWKKCLSEQ